MNLFESQFWSWFDRIDGLIALDPWITSILVQLVVVALGFPVARLLASRLRPALVLSVRHRGLRSLRGLALALSRYAVAALWGLLLLSASIVADAGGRSHEVLTLTSSLLLAWPVIGVASRTVRNPAIARSLAAMAWLIAGLNVAGWLRPTLAALDRIVIPLGTLQISLLGMLRAGATLVLLLWVATLIGAVMEARFRAIKDISPSVQVLLSKVTRALLLTLAVVVALASVGIDLTAFAVFSGAVGVGVGFGLQKVVANLVSGLILLLDRSIKPGDVIAVADYYGRVDALGARYVSVITRDGVEYLIPNEELVTSRVENWSHSQNLLRIKVPVGIHYKADLRKAISLCIEAAIETERILKEPAPVCHLRGFGDSAVDLEIRFWINDPMNGRANVTSEMLLRVWDKFHEHGIEIPYPQRDVHLQVPSGFAPTPPKDPEAG